MKTSLLIAFAILLVPTFLLEMWRFTAVFLVIAVIIGLWVSGVSFVAQRPARQASFWTGIFLVIAFYSFCVRTSDREPKVFESYPAGYYNRLVDSFIHRQLSVIEKPDPKLLALENPYIWANRNQINTLWDLSLYHGKYYVYWGVAPVLTFYLPLRVFKGSFVNEWFACWVFASLAFLFCALFMRRALRFWFQRELDAGETFLLILAIGFSSTYPYLLRRPAVYENAILAAVAFIFMSLYTLVRGLAAERALARNIFLLLSGTAYGLAIASRPTFLFAGMIPFYLLGDEFWKSRKNSAQLSVSAVTQMTTQPETPHLPSSLTLSAPKKLGPYSSLIFFSVPVALAGIGLAIYNFLRFDSFTEFGLHYQLTSFDIRTLSFHAPDFWNAWRAYLLNLPDLQLTFPFFRVVRIHPSLGGGHLYLNDEVLGILIAAPIIWITSLFCFKGARAIFERKVLMMFALFFLAVVLMVSVDAVSGIQERYTGDFSLLIQVVPLFLFFQLERIRKKRYQFLFGVFACLIVFGFTLNFFTSFTGIENRFQQNRPELYRDLGVIFGG
jgi:hypothetical protein